LRSLSSKNRLDTWARSAPLIKLVINPPPPLGVEILRQNHYLEKSDFSHSLGLHRAVPRPRLAFTYFDKNSKLQINGAIGFMTSWEESATQYQTGNEFHAEWAIGYKFDNGLLLGVVGYDYRQLTGDSSPGAILGPFESSRDAVGPGLSYSTEIPRTTQSLASMLSGALRH
jgi:hypothetical protein